MDLTHKTLNTINRYQMLKKGDSNSMLLAVSGGADSVFLFHVLHNLASKLGIRLFIAHMDHGIRGNESSRDGEFVKRLAKSFSTRLAYKKLSPKLPKTKISLEEQLREKRYDFFKDAARKFKTNIVATAHTLDDQAETVLMRIIKGASLKGIIGIHPVRVDKKIKFIRPLIEIEKKEIMQFLREEKIPFRIDRTNLEDKFLRNRIRNKVFPYLAKINPRIKRSLFNLAESLREDFAFIEHEKKKKLDIIKKKGALKYINLSDILLQPKALQKEIIREALKSIGANIKKLTFRHWRDIDWFMRDTPRNKSLCLPGRVKLKKAENRLIFAKESAHRNKSIAKLGSVATI